MEQFALSTGRQLAEDATVFVVDDDDDMRGSLESLLRSLGYRVEAFPSAQTFLERARSGMTGCVLLDVRLPGVSGLEIQRRLVEAGQVIPIIFLTAHGDIQMAVAAMKAGAVEFLPKPFREQQLIDAVAEAITRSVQDQENSRIRDAYLQSVSLLSLKELQILNDLSSGHQIKETAAKHGLSDSTVRVHRRNIKSKLQGLSFGRLLVLHSKYGEGQ